MILVDFSQCVISNIMANQKLAKELNEDLFRHSILITLRSYISKFGAEYGRLVICADSKHYWRKDVFQYYKARRAEDRKKSELDWGFIFDTLDTIKTELKENFPYQVLEVYGTEADDIIGTLVEQVTSERILIVSGDKDFLQLLRPGVAIFRPLVDELYQFKNK
jgi:Kyanoviridae ribonuclease H